MIISGSKLLNAHPINCMEDEKLNKSGASYGLTEAGYDIRIDQTIKFRRILGIPVISIKETKGAKFKHFIGSRFVLASSKESFNMPKDLVGKVHDKSSWARMGVSVFNTVIEPNWKGYLTLEIVFNGNSPVTINEGEGIAQVLFFQTDGAKCYNGHYQNQKKGPVKSKLEKRNERRKNVR